MQAAGGCLLSPPVIRAQTSAQHGFVLAAASTGGEIQLFPFKKINSDGNPFLFCATFANELNPSALESRI